MIRKLVLFTMMLVILLSTKVNASEAPVNQVKNTIVQHSVALGVDPAMALSIAKVESGYKHSSRSVQGAVGVFQLMPSTAAKMGYNPYHLSDNIKGGITYYKMMYKMFGSAEMALAAYNAGPGYVKRHQSIPSSTRRYIAAVMSEYHKIKATPNLLTAYQSAGVVPANGKTETKPSIKTVSAPIAISAHSSVKPMTASVPRELAITSNRLVVKQKPQIKDDNKKETKPQLQVSMTSIKDKLL